MPGTAATPAAPSTAGRAGADGPARRSPPGRQSPRFSDRVRWTLCVCAPRSREATGTP